MAVSADAMNSHMNKSLGRGQWPPRIVIALTLWYQHNLVELGKLFDTWHYQFRELKPLVDKILNVFAKIPLDTKVGEKGKNY